MSFSRLKIAFIAVVVLWGALAALPNFLSSEGRESLPEFLPKNTLSLGLDLQGGVQLLLAAETEDVVRTRLENLAGEVRDVRRSTRELNFKNIKVGERSVTFEVTREDMIEQARSELIKLTQAVTGGANPLLTGNIEEVTMDRDGTKFTLTLTPEGVALQQKNAVDRAMEVIRRRVDPEGTRDVSVQAQGENRIVLQVPGADNPDELRRLIETAAKLTFRDVVTGLSADDISRGRVGAGAEVLPLKDGGFIAVKKRVIVSGEDLENAAPSFDQNGRPAVAFSFNTSGSKRFGNHTVKNIGRPFAIVLDNEVISAPTIQTAILGGSGQITNIGSVTEATELATLLSAGALPVPLTLEAQSTVGPDLGADSIEAGRLASIIGFVAVVFYMLISYGRFGFAANAALIINLFLIIGFLSLFQATLTLPGIAGIVLTIGMAVDANVLIFERIREEQQLGRKPVTAFENGYSEAFSTIIDANITTFIAAAILYLLGSGPVQGFAVTLGIGILTSMFTAILLTRFFLTLWLGRARPNRLPL